MTVKIEEGAEKGQNDGDCREVEEKSDEAAPAHDHADDAISSWFLLTELW